MEEQDLAEVEVIAKRPFPKLLGLAVLLVSISATILIIDIFKNNNK